MCLYLQLEKYWFHMAMPAFHVGRANQRGRGCILAPTISSRRPAKSNQQCAKCIPRSHTGERSCMARANATCERICESLIFDWVLPQVNFSYSCRPLQLFLIDSDTIVRIAEVGRPSPSPGISTWEVRVT